jgi:integrase
MGRWYDREAVGHIVKDSAKAIGVAKLAPHDLRRTCARLCHASGGELEQIQFLLGLLPDNSRRLISDSLTDSGRLASHQEIA